MAIWRNSPKPEDLNRASRNTLIELMGIRFTEIGDDYIRATMPVDQRTIQPHGLLHGGASVTLAETLGSFASLLTIDSQRQTCVGLEINANHIRSVRSGEVTGTVCPLHVGRSTQVWEIRVTDQQERLVSISRLTMVVLEKKRQSN